MRVNWLWLLGLLLLGGFLRLFQIDSIPPGPSFDAAFYGLDAYKILDGERPVFFATNSGREALYSYFVALAFLLMGPGHIAIYVTSAAFGILTIPVVYVAARELLADEEPALREWGPRLAALVVTISYWHIQLSRQGLRAILVPLFAGLTIYYLWRGLRTGQVWAFVACGLSLGLGLYTYQAIRLIPVLMVIGCLIAWRYPKHFVAFQWRSLALVGGVALVVAAPLGLYAIQHPSEFNERVTSALVFNTETPLTEYTKTLSETVLNGILLYNFRGNDSPIMTIPGRPVLDSILSLAFWLGIGVCLWRLKRPLYPFLLIWLGLLTVPAMIAIQGAAEKRASGTLPAVALLIAIGLVGSWEAVARASARWMAGQRHAVTRGYAVLVGAGLIVSLAVTYRDYFIVWGQDPDLFAHFEAGQAAIGRYIAELPANERIYVSPVAADHAGIRLMSHERQGVTSYNGRVCVVMPDKSAQGTTWIIVPKEDRRGLRLLDQFYPEGRIVRDGPLYYEEPYFRAYRAPAGAQAVIEPDTPTDLRWDDHLALLGYNLDKTTFKVDDTISITFYLKALKDMETNYTMFVQLRGPAGASPASQVLAQHDSQPCDNAYPTSVWREDEIVRDVVRVDLPDTIRPGDYHLVIGLYHWPDMGRLPILDGGGRVVGNEFDLGEVKITAS